MTELDGVPWGEGDEEHNVAAGILLKRWMELLREKSSLVVEEELEAVGPVRDCMTLEMSDGRLTPMLQGVADDNSPVIFTNACASWHELSDRFVFSGARAYVGTAFPVLASEAAGLAWQFFAKHVHRPSSGRSGLRNKMLFEDSHRFPYIMVGPPFIRLKRHDGDARVYLRRRMQKAADDWNAYAEKQEDQVFRENALHFKDFLTREKSRLEPLLRS